MDQLEADGIVGPDTGSSKPRQVLITLEKLKELKMAKPASGESNEE